MRNWLSIGQIAKKTSVSARALRIYEKKGLISSVERGENGYRYYKEEQVQRVQKICEFKKLGFSLKEIQVLIELDLKETDETSPLISLLQTRQQQIESEQVVLKEQREQIRKILSSLKKKDQPLNKEERRYVMELFKRVTIVVTGVNCLVETAEYIQEQLKSVGQEALIVDWSKEKKVHNISQPRIFLVKEEELNDEELEEINPDVVVIKNLSQYTKDLVNQYLTFYKNVGPHMATVINADDLASIEVAKMSDVKKGAIYYYSKNSGLKEQIRKIGGVLSDGDEIEVFGFSRKAGGPLNIKLGQILSQDQETALLAALGAVINIGISREEMPLAF